MRFINIITSFLALPTALGAPTAQANSNALTSSSDKRIFKRDASFCIQQNESGYRQAPTIPDSDVQGLINTINGMSSPYFLQQWGGTFRVTYGSAMLCITNQYAFCNTHLTMGEAAWVASWIAYDECNLGGDPNNFLGGTATCHGDDGLSLDATLASTSEGC